jgi:hypothetical protein
MRLQFIDTCPLQLRECKYIYKCEKNKSRLKEKKTICNFLICLTCIAQCVYRTFVIHVKSQSTHISLNHTSTMNYECLLNNILYAVRYDYVECQGGISRFLNAYDGSLNSVTSENNKHNKNIYKKNEILVVSKFFFIKSCIEYRHTCVFNNNNSLSLALSLFLRIHKHKSYFIAFLLMDGIELLYTGRKKKQKKKSFLFLCFIFLLSFTLYFIHILIVHFTVSLTFNVLPLNIQL